MIGVERTPEARLVRLYAHARCTAWLYSGYTRGTAYEALRPRQMHGLVVFRLHQRHGLRSFTPTPEVRLGWLYATPEAE